MSRQEKILTPREPREPRTKRTKTRQDTKSSDSQSSGLCCCLEKSRLVQKRYSTSSYGANTLMFMTIGSTIDTAFLVSLQFVVLGAKCRHRSSQGYGGVYDACAGG